MDALPGQSGRCSSAPSKSPGPGQGSQEPASFLRPNQHVPPNIPRTGRWGRAPAFPLSRDSSQVTCLNLLSSNKLSSPRRVALVSGTYMLLKVFLMFSLRVYFVLRGKFISPLDKVRREPAIQCLARMSESRFLHRGLRMRRHVTGAGHAHWPRSAQEGRAHTLAGQCV